MARAPQNGTGCTCHASPWFLLDWGESLAHRAQNEFSSPCQCEFSLCAVGSFQTTKNTNSNQTDITCISGKSFCNFDRGLGGTRRAGGESLKAVDPGVPGLCCWAAMRAFRRSKLGSSEAALGGGWKGPPADSNGGSLEPRSGPTPSACMNCCCCASDHAEVLRGALLTRSFSRSARCLLAVSDTDRG